MRRTPTRTTSAAVCGTILLALGGDALADSKQECAAAYDATQALKDKGRLVEARQQAVKCSATTCSAYVVEECVRWLSEIDQSLPTVVFTAKDPAGSDTLGVRVSVDGQALGERLDGKSVPLNPGEHLVRLEMPGAEILEQKVIITQGQKNRELAFALKAKRLELTVPPPATGGPIVTAPAATQSPASPKHTWQRPTAIAFLSLGGVGVAVGAVAGALVLAQHGPLVAECGGGCTASKEGDRNAYYAKATVSDVGFVAGASAAALGAVLLLTAPKGASWGVGGTTPYLGIGTLGLMGRF